MGVKPPFGILVLSALYALGGILSIIGGIGLLIAMYSKSSMFAVLGVVAIVMGVISIYIARGLYELDASAWLLAVLISAINIITYIVSLATGYYEWNQSIFGIIVYIVVLAVLIYYSKHFNISLRGKPAKPAPEGAVSSTINIGKTKFFRRL